MLDTIYIPFRDAVVGVFKSTVVLDAVEGIVVGDIVVAISVVCSVVDTTKEKKPRSNKL